MKHRTPNIERRTSNGGTDLTQRSEAKLTAAVRCDARDQRSVDRNEEWRGRLVLLGGSGYLPVQDKGRQKRKARTSGPFLRFSESYCFGTGSAPKLPWTNTHLSPFFTKTRVDL